MGFLKNRYTVFCAILLMFSLAGDLIAQQAGKIQFRQGGNTLTVRSGATIAYESGSMVTGLMVADSISVGKLYYKIPTVAITADTTALTAAQSGTLFYARPIVGKAQRTLPSAAAGLVYEFEVGDTDSLLITAATGDSIIVTAGTAAKTITSVAATCKLIAIDAVRWLLMSPVGTWTSY